MKATDQSAFESLIRRIYTQLVRYARSYVHSLSTAEDVVMDVLARVWERRDNWPATGMEAYLFRSVRNQAMDHLRHAGVETRLFVEDDDAIDDATAKPGAESGFPEDEASSERLDPLLAILTPRQREAIYLRYNGGLTHAELASVMGISLRAAEQLVSRALTAMRDAAGGIQ